MANDDLEERKAILRGSRGLAANEDKLFPADYREPGLVRVCKDLLLRLGQHLLQSTASVMLEGGKKLKWDPLHPHFSFSLTFFCHFPPCCLICGTEQPSVNGVNSKGVEVS